MVEYINEIGTLIGTLGFPIVCCIALFVKMDKDAKQNAEKSDKFTEAINNNTIALTKITTKLGGE